MAPRPSPPDPSLTDYPRPPAGAPTGISIIIVGAGLGGLACAIESRMQGHEVTVLEQTAVFRPLGDNIGLFPNSGRIHYELSKHCGFPDGLQIRKYDGTLIVHQNKASDTPPLPEDVIQKFKDAPLYDTERAALHEIMIKRAKELGATVIQGVRVEKFAESSHGASVVAGEKSYTADVVIGADGVKSKARELVLGILDAPKPSGYAIYRTSYSADLIRANPMCAHLAPVGEDARTVWIGKDIHFIHGTSRSGKQIHWLLTHLDTGDVSESWTYPGKPEDAQALVQDWDPVVSAVISTTPKDSLIDWKLVYRDPLPRWVSTGGRICVMGDSAHTFLPTSQQGASQAVEDGVTIAHCLSLAKKHGHSFSLALNTFEKLRYERVKAAQQVGFNTRNMWHKIDWSKPVDPDSVKLGAKPWLWDHDATAHAHENYLAIATELINPSQDVNLAAVPKDGYVSAQVANGVSVAV